MAIDYLTIPATSWTWNVFSAIIDSRGLSPSVISHRLAPSAVSHHLLSLASDRSSKYSPTNCPVLTVQTLSSTKKGTKRRHAPAAWVKSSSSSVTPAPSVLVVRNATITSSSTGMKPTLAVSSREYYHQCGREDDAECARRRDAYAAVEAWRTSRALLRRDQVMLAVLLAQVKLQGTEDISDGLEFLLESEQGIGISTAPA